MSNIDKRALREAAEKATKGQWAVEFDDEVYSTDGVNNEQIAMVFSENEVRDAAFIATANPATVLALLDELESADVLNKHLELAIRRAEGCSEALRRKLEAAEEQISELSELLKKSEVEKKQPQNTLNGRPVYLGDGSDTKEKVIAGKRDIHRYESLITNRVGKGD